MWLQHAINLRFAVSNPPIQSYVILNSSLLPWMFSCRFPLLGAISRLDWRGLELIGFAVVSVGSCRIPQKFQGPFRKPKLSFGFLEFPVPIDACYVEMPSFHRLCFRKLSRRFPAVFGIEHLHNQPKVETNLPTLTTDCRNFLQGIFPRVESNRWSLIPPFGMKWIFAPAKGPALPPQNKLAPPPLCHDSIWEDDDSVLNCLFVQMIKTFLTNSPGWIEKQHIPGVGLGRFLYAERSFPVLDR